MPGSGAGDEDDRAYLSLAEASDVVRQVAQMPMAHYVVSACGTRTLAVVDAMIEMGLPADALATVGNFAPDLSASGMTNAYATRRVMSSRQPFAAHAAATRIARDEHGVVTDGRWSADGATVEPCPLREQNVPGVSVTATPGGQRWQLPETGYPSLYVNDFVAAVRVRTGDAVQLMTVTPFFDRHRPLPLDELKRRQHLPESVITVSEPGGPYRLHVPSLDGPRLRLLADILDRSGLDRGEPTARLGRLDDDGHRRVLTELLRLPPPGQSAERTPDGEREAFHASYSAALAGVLRSPVGLLRPGETLGPAALPGHLAMLRPLQTYQEHLSRTDRLLAADAGGGNGRERGRARIPRARAPRRPEPRRPAERPGRDRH
ncbi:MAG TPA: hypothetical protein VF053_04045 [Streptosporangiales bacterium]